MEFGITKHLYNDKIISEDRKRSILSQLATYKKVIISLHDLSIYSSKEFGITKSMFDLIYELNSRQEVILVNNGSPYALMYFPKISTIVQALSLIHI